MPLEFAAELFIRFVFQAIFHVLGYATGWLLIPGLSFGYFSVEPLAAPRRGLRRVRSTGPRAPRQLSADTAAALGILFWVLAAALVMALWWIASR